MLRSNVGQLERAPEALGGGLILLQMPVQLADHRVEQVVGLQPAALRNGRNRIESGLRSVQMRDYHRAV